MTDARERIEAIRKRLEALDTEGWGYQPSSDPECPGYVMNERGCAAASFVTEEDGQFIAHSREDIPFLLELLNEAVEMAEFYAERGNVYGMHDSFLEWSNKENGCATQAGQRARAFLAKVGRG